jgi:pimeloyl-ACP methyl ester carboxylesterase
MPELDRGTVQANGLKFHYLAAGAGPLALCLHGFPDSPWTYRHLLPELARAGYRAVAPFNRGFAPTELPADRHHVHTSTMVADALALNAALGGGSDSVLIAHDWGAVAAWGAAGRAPERWGRCVILNIPPFEIFGENIVTYDQIKRSFYFWYFQLQHVIEPSISANDFEFIDRIWGDWSPGYDAREDLPLVKECIRNPAHLQAALGYYWGQFDPTRFGSPSWVEEQTAAWGYSLEQPTLYLHGTNDGCHGMSAEQVARVPGYCGPGSESELIEGVGHFMLVERPAEINERITGFLKRTAPVPAEAVTAAR